VTVNGFGDEEREEEELAQEEAEEASREAAGIGGMVDYDVEDPAEQPLVESGEGEEEGFELAEQDAQDRDEDFTPPDR
jgi:hypothetical protein